MADNKKSIEELISENKHLKELFDQHGPDFLLKENDQLRELTKAVLQLRYLDKENPNMNKETKKKIEEKVTSMMETYKFPFPPLIY